MTKKSKRPSGRKSGGTGGRSGNRKPHGRPEQSERTALSRPRDERTQSSTDKAPGGGKIWLYGNHAVIAALANPVRRKHRLLVTAESAQQLDKIYVHDKPDLVAEQMDRRDMDRLLPPGAVHQGMALLASPLPSVDLEDVCRDAPEQSVLIVLDQPNDPQNIGAVLRSASAFGALAVVVPDRHTPEATATLAKAASGALDRIPLVRVNNLTRAMEQLKKAGFWCYGLDGHADTTISETNLDGKVALVLGTEGAGLRQLTRETCDVLVRIPISTEMESLNLSNAAAVSLYEWSRGTTE